MPASPSPLAPTARIVNACDMQDVRRGMQTARWFHHCCQCSCHGVDDLSIDDNAAGSLPCNGGTALRVQIVDHTHNFAPCTQCLYTNWILEIPDFECRLG